MGYLRSYSDAEGGQSKTRRAFRTFLSTPLSRDAPVQEIACRGKEAKTWLGGLELLSHDENARHL